MKFRVSSISFMKYLFYENVMTDEQNILMSDSIFVYLNLLLTSEFLFI